MYNIVTVILSVFLIFNEKYYYKSWHSKMLRAQSIDTLLLFIHYFSQTNNNMQYYNDF